MATSDDCPDCAADIAGWVERLDGRQRDVLVKAVAQAPDASWRERTRMPGELGQWVMMKSSWHFEPTDLGREVALAILRPVAPLTRRDLDTMPCPGCVAAGHAPHRGAHRMVLRAKCHPGSGCEVHYIAETGCLHIFCKDCAAPIALVAVSEGPT